MVVSVKKDLCLYNNVFFVAFGNIYKIIEDRQT